VVNIGWIILFICYNILLFKYYFISLLLAFSEAPWHRCVNEQEEWQERGQEAAANPTTTLNLYNVVGFIVSIETYNY
jgi:uncharacterized protein involved in cysteine biosynthesis